MLDHVLEFSQRDDSNKWSNMSIGSKITSSASMSVEKYSKVYVFIPKYPRPNRKCGMHHVNSDVALNVTFLMTSLE